MAAPEDDRDRARRDALAVAAVLRRVPGENTVEAAAQLLGRWRTDDDVRAALRPVFAAAVPDQRALIALGDVDAWLPDGRAALDHWEEAAAGPDVALAAEAAYRAGLAHRRAGRRDAADPFLRQAAAAGFTEAADALRRSAREEAAEAVARRMEERLVLVERCLDADDLVGAEGALRTVVRPGSASAGPFVLEERTLRGELAFRRGELDDAERYFDTAWWNVRPRHVQLRLAQIATARRDPARAYKLTLPLTDVDDEIGAAAWLLLGLHTDLMAAGMPMPLLCTRRCECCCECCVDCEGLEGYECDCED